MELEIDKWDSNSFGIKIARLNIFNENGLVDLLESAENKGFDFVVGKVINGLQSERILLSFGFKKCSESVSLLLSSVSGINGYPYIIRHFRIEDINEVKVICRDAFRLSYLYKCGFAEQSVVDSYHMKWAENLSADDNTIFLVADISGEVVGFIAMYIDRDRGVGRIVLIAVSENYRGFGIGKDLLLNCALRKSGLVKNIEVKTQKDNERALSLYKSAGFKIVGSDKVFFKKY